MGFFNKIFKPVSKVLDKIIPNEIKPALPFAAAAFPFLAPELFASMGGLGGLITNPIAQRAVAGGLTNLASQASQEGAANRGINPMSLGLGTLGGALTAPSSEFGNLYAAPQTMGGFEVAASDLSSLDKLQNSVLGGAKTASDFFNKGVTGLDQNGILDPTFLKAYAPGAVGAASDLSYNAAKDAQLKYQDQLSSMGQTSSANRQNQIDYIRKAMTTAGFTSSEIDDAITRSGFAQGGRAGYGMGGDVIKSLKGIKGKLTDYLGKLTDDIKIHPYTDYADDAGSTLDLTIYPKSKKGKKILDDLQGQGYVKQHRDGSYFMSNDKLEEGTILLDELGAKASGVYEPSMKGDRFDSFRSGAGLSEYGTPYHGYDLLRENLYKNKKADGGLMSLGGHEMDYRAAGGFVPIGQKERADDVPARLSKNEFVFTAKAVRNAGGGDIKEGAKRMYQIMKQLEAK
jgi:hypothetical protein